MRAFIPTLLTLFVVAQFSPATGETAGPLAETYIAGDSIEPVVHAAWDDMSGAGSRVNMVTGQAAAGDAPQTAVRYKQKSFDFPSGSIRVLEFEKAQGGMLHPISVETTMYMLAGEGTVGVDGETVLVKQGDVVSYPSGVLRGDGDATVVTWTVTGNKSKEESRPMVVRSEDTTFAQLGYWYGPDGERTIVTTAEELEDAPVDAIRLDMTSYPFDGNSLVVTKNYKSGPTNKTRGDRDALLYITSGKMRFFQDDVDVIAGPGDAIRETAGRYHNWIRLEDSSFIGIGTAPVVPLEPDAPSDY